MLPSVAIGGVVRNRAWALPDYLEALTELIYPTYRKHYLFLENDSDDGSGAILDDFVPEPGAAKTVEHVRTGVGHWRRGEYAAGQYVHLALIRNKFLEMFLATGADYLFSVDSDVIVRPAGLLRQLVRESQGNTIVGAAISNIPGQPLDGSTPGNFMIGQRGVIMHPPHYAPAGVMDVAVTGACYLIPRGVIEAGVRYGQHPQGEDIPFCLAAAKLGYPIKVILDPTCEHRMVAPAGA